MVAGASPALVSSLLIRSDQVRRSMFGFRSARSTLAAQWSILRFVVQLSYRSSFAYVALCLRVHHQVSGPIFTYWLTVQIGTLLHPHGLLQVMDSRLTVMPLT